METIHWVVTGTIELIESHCTEIQRQSRSNDFQKIHRSNWPSETNDWPLIRVSRFTSLEASALSSGSSSETSYNVFPQTSYNFFACQFKATRFMSGRLQGDDLTLFTLSIAFG